MLNQSKTVLNIHFSNGVGNNIFQYMFGFLVAEKHDYILSHPALPALGIKEKVIKRKESNLKTHVFYKINNKNNNELQELMNRRYRNTYIYFKGYPEDYTLYTPFRDQLLSIFEPPVIQNTKDLILHLRAGDRLLINSCFKNGNPIPVSDYVEAIKQFNFNKLYIVTDMPVWNKITVDDLNDMVFHRTVKEKDKVNPEIAVKYWNDLYTALNEFDPIVRTGNTVEYDFNYIRTFDQILFAHGTLAWWAAFLSNASKVGLYGKWRANKNINLGWTDIEGWFQWGGKTAPPRSVKEKNLIDCAEKGKHRIFVETGTKGATMLLALHTYFKKMYSVEIIKPAYEKAKRKISKININNKIELFCGDSSNELKHILKKVNEPSLFWLDAHDGRNSTPIMNELDLILPSKLAHTLIIDDSRYFGTEKAYPSIEDVKTKVKKLCPNAKVDVKFDSIRIFMP